MSIRLGLSLLLLCLLGAGCTNFPLPAAESTVTGPTAPVATVATLTATPTEQATLAAPVDITPTVAISAELPATPALILVPTAESLTSSAIPTPTQLLPVSITPTSSQPLILVPTATPVITGSVALTGAESPESPMARALNGLNLRAGPSTEYPILGGLATGDEVAINGQNAAGDWWQVALADGTVSWVYAPLVAVRGVTATVTVVETIPPPPTATPSPPPQPQPVTESAASEAVPPTATAAPPADPPPTAPPASDGPDFRVIQKRLWDVYENGGSLFGDSVSCGEKRQLEVVVVDANGVRLSGVAVQAQYGAREIFVTGSQGKGDGAVEFVLGSGQDVTVIRDVDGRAVTSEMATGLVTRPDAIAYEQLIAARYCSDEASCAHFVAAPGCLGHFSWTVIFQRQY